MKTVYELDSIGNANMVVDGVLVANVTPQDAAYLAWLAEGNIPAPVGGPTHASLIAQARATALPIRQRALDVLSGLAVDCLVAANADGAAMCKAARDRVKDMGALDLSGCTDYEAMRQAYKVQWAVIGATFASQPDLRDQFNKALK
jgi:hypothetical protein